jgi:hypothetical protein
MFSRLSVHITALPDFKQKYPGKGEPIGALGQFSSQYPIHLISHNCPLGNKWQRTKIFVFNSVFAENEFPTFNSMLKNVTKILILNRTSQTKAEKNKNVSFQPPFPHNRAAFKYSGLSDGTYR